MSTGQIVKTQHASARILSAGCEVEYTGRLTTRLLEAFRLLMIKADGGVLIWNDGGSSPGRL